MGLYLLNCPSKWRLAPPEHHCEPLLQAQTTAWSEPTSPSIGCLPPGMQLFACLRSQAWLVSGLLLQVMLRLLQDMLRLRQAVVSIAGQREGHGPLFGRPHVKPSSPCMWPVEAQNKLSKLPQ